ncbi:hypothetical protein [Rhodovulum kholense]|uniref:hypothetical protein n=1 Tax=Rhodovulum kholense TaxID=453584 RepID=UPI0011B22E08|nr:hypothetical protein [Rhodovulum kholense]
MAEHDDQVATKPLSEWRQGDFALGVGSFLFGDLPEEGDQESIGAFFDDVDPAGFVVVSQTCDVVSDPGKFGFVAVCPLIQVNGTRIKEIARGRAPRLGFVEHAPDGFVADLARPMTVSKQLLASWERRIGFSDPKQAFEFSRSIERTFGRFAFPDAFNECIRPLLSKAASKYGKPDSPLGKALRSLSELRVRPSTNDWRESDIRVQFFLIFEPKEKRVLSPFEIKVEFEAVLNELPWQDGYGPDDPLVRIGDYDDFLARDYVESFPLDVNALSFAAAYSQD